MASRPTWVDVLTKDALETFSDTFKLVSDTTLYKFESHTFGNGEVADVLHIGRYDVNKNKKNRKPLWARVREGQCGFHYKKDNQLIKLEGGTRSLYPDQGTTRHRDAVVPFSLVAPPLGGWPNEKEDKARARQTTRDSLYSLVEFAFILTGRVNYGRLGLLEELEDLCSKLQQHREGHDQAEATSMTDGEHEFVLTADEDLPLRQMQPLSKASGSSSTTGDRVNKRAVFQMEGTSAEDSLCGSSKRIRPTGTTPPHFHDTGAYETMQHMINSLLQGYQGIPRCQLAREAKLLEENTNLKEQVSAGQTQLAQCQSELAQSQAQRQAQLTQNQTQLAENQKEIEKARSEAKDLREKYEQLHEYLQQAAQQSAQMFATKG